MNPVKLEIEPITTYLRANRVPITPVVRAGDLLFVSALPPFLPDGNLKLLPLSQQVEIEIKQMQLCLEKAGSSLDRVVKCTIYTDDSKNYTAINEVYERYFRAPQPARAFVCVADWHGPFHVEMDCIAMVGN